MPLLNNFTFFFFFRKNNNFFVIMQIDFRSNLKNENTLKAKQKKL